VTSRLNSRFWANEKYRRYFWWTIGFDQFLHQTSLIVLAAILF
jgi:hypothetical protein